ncbi:extracellular solute-binding protein [Desertimonas flava]|uniref:extracellular solute-binding protein n=1 Tax=Desertimonas flava TaxID=2064846 RepID=UPI000E34F77F|nr:extracellular solute-binding protein [Desertimonas flava]
MASRKFDSLGASGGSPLGRRRFLGYGAAAASAALLAGRGSGLAAAGRPGPSPRSVPPGSTGPGPGRYGGPAPTQIGGKLTFVAGDSEGPVAEARKKYLFDVLAEDYGVEVTVIGTLDYALVEAQIRTNQIDWDIIDADAFFAARAAQEGWLEPIDYSIVDPSQLIDGAAKEFSVLAGVGAHHIAWNTEQAYGPGEGPATWAEFFDPEAFPGRRAFRSGALQTLPGAALAAGIAPADLYPLDLDAAFESLERVRDTVVKWVDGGQPMQDLALGGEADLFNFYTSRCVTLKSQGEPIDFRFDQGTAEEADFVIIKGSPNTLQAQHAMALAFNTPEFHTVLAEATNIGFTNKLGMEMVDPAIQPLLSTAPENYALLTPAGNDWWAANQADAEQRFAEWILG